ncbi:hypothetical protein DFJ74DRAFT_652716 [Hyaloraphidium curvatum]|nr:hypothetical protein DFJ74DRAFT_652716 [Hyaloraphidium curvatum]
MAGLVGSEPASRVRREAGSASASEPAADSVTAEEGTSVAGVASPMAEKLTGSGSRNRNRVLRDDAEPLPENAGLTRRPAPRSSISVRSGSSAVMLSPSSPAAACSSARRSSRAAQSMPALEGTPREMEERKSTAARSLGLSWEYVRLRRGGAGSGSGASGASCEPGVKIISPREERRRRAGGRTKVSVGVLSVPGAVWEWGRMRSRWSGGLPERAETPEKRDVGDMGESGEVTGPPSSPFKATMISGSEVDRLERLDMAETGWAPGGFEPDDVRPFVRVLPSEAFPSTTPIVSGATPEAEVSFLSGIGGGGRPCGPYGSGSAADASPSNAAAAAPSGRGGRRSGGSTASFDASPDAWSGSADAMSAPPVGG